MIVAKFRTHSTSLSDGELLILDVMFANHVTAPMLRHCNFEPQFYAESHSLDDNALYKALRRLRRDGVITPTDESFRGHRYIKITALGGELWSQERCPIWERYCLEYYRNTSRGRTRMTVCAVSPAIRDDFLRVWPYYPARRRVAIIRDFGLVHWHPCDELHVGLASYDERDAEWEYTSWLEHVRRIDRERTWWRGVDELQLFLQR